MAGDPHCKKKRLDAYYHNERAALALASESSLPGVAKLVACPSWNGSPALVLEYHGE